MTAPAPDMLAAALAYAAQGWPVVPCHTIEFGVCTCHEGANCGSSGKHPRTKNGCKDASKDDDVIRSWWKKWPSANIGIATGNGLFVIDIDPDKGGNDSLLELERKYKPLPDTYVVHSGGGGRHLYYTLPPGVALRCSGGVVAPGIDIRGQGGHIIAPPSLHISGRRYEVAEASIPAVPAPEWLLTLIQQASPPSVAQNGAAGNGVAGNGAPRQKITKNYRTKHLVSLAATMLRRGMDAGAIEAGVWAENLAVCEPPLSEEKVRRKIVRDLIQRYSHQNSTSEHTGEGTKPNGHAGGTQANAASSPVPSNGSGQAAADTPQDDRPWPNGAAADESNATNDIVTQVEQFIRKYLFAPDAVYLPLAIQFIATHVADVFYSFPYGGVTSPTKGCGKTRVIELASLLCAKVQVITASSVAALFRMLSDCPTMLWDECESFRSKHRSESTDLIIQILNTGYKKGAKVPRADGPNHSINYYPVYGPKFFTAIRELPETLADRSIRYHIQRRPKGKKLAGRWKERRVKSEATPIRKAIEQWAQTNRDNVIQTDDHMEDLEFLEDREDEIWSPLFVVCSVIAPERYEDLKECALTLTKKKASNDVENELPLKLLADLCNLESEITKLREQNDTGKLVVSGAALVGALKALPESPWNDPKHELTERRLARMLHPFEIAPRQTRVSEKSGLSRYFVADFEAAFSAYLSVSGKISSTSSTNRMDIEDSADFHKLYKG